MNHTIWRSNSTARSNLHGRHGAWNRRPEPGNRRSDRGSAAKTAAIHISGLAFWCWEMRVRGASPPLRVIEFVLEQHIKQKESMLRSRLRPPVSRQEAGGRYGASSRLIASPACLVGSEMGYSPQMGRLLQKSKRAGRDNSAFWS